MFSNNKESNEALSGQALTVGCTGWDIYPMSTKLDKSKIVFSAKLNKKPMQSEGYCNNMLGEKFL
jgi:hypothetical protein